MPKRDREPQEPVKVEQEELWASEEEETSENWDGGWSSSESDDDDDDGDHKSAELIARVEDRYKDHLEAARVRSRRRQASAAVENLLARASDPAGLVLASAPTDGMTRREKLKERVRVGQEAARIRAQLPQSALARRVALELGRVPSGLGEAVDPREAGVVNLDDEEMDVERRTAPLGSGTADARSLRIHADDLSSDDEAPKNTAGASVPREWYAGMPIVGYDVSGQAIGRKDGQDRISQFLKSQEDPVGFRWTVYDSENDEEVTLSARDVAMIRNMRAGGYAHPEFDETSEAYSLHDLFSEPTDDPAPVSSGPVHEPKRRFLPSKWETMKIRAMRKAIAEGKLRIKTAEERELELDPKRREREAREPKYSLWGADGMALEGESRQPSLAHIAAPKPRPPGHAASYRPPREYLLTEEEREVWKRTPRHRRPAGLEGDLEPAMYDSLRQVPAYAPLLTERFERCLDLYLAPRATRKRLNVSDVESLLPKLPDPRELRPFPTTRAVSYVGHKGRVRCVDVSPDGQWLASGGDDATVRIWDLETGREVRRWHFASVEAARVRAAESATKAAKGSELDAELKLDPSQRLGSGSVIVGSVRWNPNALVHALAVAVGTDVVVLYPGLATPAQLPFTHSVLAGAKAESSRRGDTVEETTEMDRVIGEKQARAAALSSSLVPVKVPGGAGVGGPHDAVSGAEQAALDAEARDKPLEDAPRGRDAFDESVDGEHVPKAKRRFVRWMWIAGRKDDGGEDEEEQDHLVSQSVYKRYNLSEDDLASPEALGRPGSAGVVVSMRHHAMVRCVEWHPKGDYLVSVCPEAPVAPVLLHQLSRRRSQFPFTEAGLGLKGNAVQSAMFHPSLPEIFVASRRTVRRFSLAKKELVQKLEFGSKWISSMTLQPEGEHVVVGGFDCRVSWFDSEVSGRPWKTLRYHDEAVRDVKFHPGKHPLLATASDDGRVQVFHARPPIEADMSMDPMVVPVKILRPCARTADGLATLALAWHPKQPWVVTAGADGVAVLHQDLP
jgi:hypothetical protein